MYFLHFCGQCNMYLREVRADTVLCIDIDSTSTECQLFLLEVHIFMYENY